MSDGAKGLAEALSDRYRIERELGQGGMATVYLAEDFKHDRKVAVKVLKPELAAMIGAARFLREIKTIASLQHPHILGLIDSGEVAGTAYFVMPFVEGESLRDRLNREKQLPMSEAVRITIEIAAALGYAHRHGVIHRDIKPENILLHDGQVLVADFGIALAVSSAGGARMTETGMSLGTPDYMSPEQAMGERDITAASDVYALGCVLYEMLVGEPPFTGPSAQAIVAKVMMEKPTAPSRLRDTVPDAVDVAVLTALQKLPADRFASATAFADALRNPQFSSVVPARMIAREQRSPVRRAAGAFAWIALGAVASTIAVRQWPSPQQGGNAERQQVTYSGLAGAPAISADGRFVAYLETRCPDPPAMGGCMSLRVLEVGSASPVEIISGAIRLGVPRWTHDSLSLVVAGALDAGRSGLFVVPRLGGIPRRIADEPLTYDTHASADSVALIKSVGAGWSLHVVAVKSGSTVGASIPILFEPRDLAWSPDGARFAVSCSDEIVVLARKDGAVTSSLKPSQTRDALRWSVDGRHLLSFRWTASQDDLVAFPVDGQGRLGQATLLASQVSTLLLGRFDVARGTGRIAVGSGSGFGDIWSFDLTGGQTRARRLTQGTNWFGPPVLTADGRTLHFLRADALGTSLYQIVDGKETALTAERQAVQNALRLARDERSITFESNVDSVVVLMIYDVASGTSRQVPRAQEEKGWLLPGDGGILWIDGATRSLLVSDANGGSRRAIFSEAIARQTKDSVTGQSTQWNFATWSLAPDGESVALLGSTPVDAIVARISIPSGAMTIVRRFPRADGTVGFAGWTADGAIHFARAGPARGETTLLHLDAMTGVTRSEVVLPAACDLTSVSYAQGGRAACLVPDSRADVMLFDGVRP